MDSHIINFHLSVIPTSFSSEKCLLLTSVAYIEVHFRLDFIMEVYVMDLDQTAALLAAILFVILAT